MAQTVCSVHSTVTEDGAVKKYTYTHLAACPHRTEMGISSGAALQCGTLLCPAWCYYFEIIFIMCV